MTSTLVIAPQWIGDAVMTEPLLRRLHARGDRITVGALPWVAPVYRAMACAERVIEFPFAHGGLQWAARRVLASQLRGQFDRAVICPNSFKSALIPWWAGIPERVGYLGEARYGLLTQRLPNPSKTERPPMVAFYGALSGDDGFALERPQLFVAEAAADAALAPFSLHRGKYYSARCRIWTCQALACGPFRSPSMRSSVRARRTGAALGISQRSRYLR